MLLNYFVALLVFTQSAKPEDVEEFVNKQLKAIGVIQENIKKSKNGTINAIIAAKKTIDKGDYFIFQTKEAKEKAIAGYQQQLEQEKNKLDEYRAGKIPDTSKGIGDLEFPLKVGAVGFIQTRSARVMNVLGKDKVLAKIYHTVDTFRVVNQNQAIKDFKTYDFTVVIKGIPTAGVASDTGIDVPQALEVKETYTYATALGGQNTVFVLEPHQPKKDPRTPEQIALEQKQLEDKILAIREKRKKDEQEELAKESSKKPTNVSDSANDQIAKLIKGLQAAEKRYSDSFNESNPQLAKQMADQSEIYIKNSGKRLADAIKAMDASGINKTEKNRLIAEANEAIAKAKKTVGIP